MTLVILAAGMGSRFGGLKQIEPIGPNGEFIIDYSIYDAIQAGFEKVIFIIKEENYDLFRDTVGKRIEGQIKVEYAFQSMDNVPDGVTIPAERVKPLGTGHALYCAKDLIDEPFALISADDFYGREPFDLLADSLKKDGEFGVIGYKIANNISDNGSVKRGVIFAEGGYLDKIVESIVERIDGVIVGKPIDGGLEYTMEDDHPVSMLMYGIHPTLLEFIEDDMKKTLLDSEFDWEKGEYYLPIALSDYAEKENIKLKLLTTKATWKGVTYKEELEEIKEYIKGLIDEGVYPNNLY